MEFNMCGYQAVIIPHLPANWEQLSHTRLGHTSNKRPTATDPSRRTYIGTSVYLRSHFDFQQLQVIESDTASNLVSSNPNVGTAWVSSETGVDPATGLLTNVLSAANHSGAYSYYQRTKREPCRCCNTTSRGRRRPWWSSPEALSRLQERSHSPPFSSHHERSLHVHARPNA